MKLDNINSRGISVILSAIKRQRNCRIDIPLIANIIGFVCRSQEGLTESKRLSVDILSVG